MTNAFSRVLQITYPAVVALAAATLAWTRTVQSLPLITAAHAHPPGGDPELSGGVAPAAAADASCKVQDRFRVTSPRSCPDGTDSLIFFNSGN